MAPTTWCSVRCPRRGRPSPAREAENANSLDEVADSAWFTNRLGVQSHVGRGADAGACSPRGSSTDHAADGAWLVDKGKTDGSSPRLPGEHPARASTSSRSTRAPRRGRARRASSARPRTTPSASTRPASRWSYFRPSLLRLKPGLKSKGNFGAESGLRSRGARHIVSLATKDGARVQSRRRRGCRVSCSARSAMWARAADDPNDIIPHERGASSAGGACWPAGSTHFDAREQNMHEHVDASERRTPRQRRPATSALLPGYERLPGLRVGLGADHDAASGYSYVADWGDIGKDFVTLGIPLARGTASARRPGTRLRLLQRRQLRARELEKRVRRTRPSAG